MRLPLEVLAPCWRASSVPALALLLGLGLLCATVVRAETAYVTDMLQLDLYDNFELSGRPIRKLRSGDRMEILERRDRKARVRLDDDANGWVRSLYIVTAEPARTRVNQLEADAEQLDGLVGDLRAQLTSRQARVAELEGDETGTVQRTEKAERDAAQLQVDNAALREKLGRYNSSVPLSWFLWGLVGMLILGGVLGWYWVDRASRARHGGYRVY